MGAISSSTTAQEAVIAMKNASQPKRCTIIASGTPALAAPARELRSKVTCCSKPHVMRASYNHGWQRECISRTRQKKKLGHGVGAKDRLGEG